MKTITLKAQVHMKLLRKNGHSEISSKSYIDIVIPADLVDESTPVLGIELEAYATKYEHTETFKKE